MVKQLQGLSQFPVKGNDDVKHSSSGTENCEYFAGSDSRWLVDIIKMYQGIKIRSVILYGQYQNMLGEPTCY